MTLTVPLKKNFNLLTAAQVEALPDPEWMIGGIFPVGGLVVLYGPSNIGKSLLSLDWAAHLSEGLPWMELPVKSGGGVVYVYAEGVSGLKSRIRAWKAEHAPDLRNTQELPNLHFLTHPVEIPNRKEDIPGLIAAIKQLHPAPGLIVIDTLARNFGGGDENSTQDMNAFVAGLDELKNAFEGATVLVVHHSGKEGKKGARGNTALVAAADTVMHLTGNRPNLKLECQKQKDGELFKRISLYLKAMPEQSSAVLIKGSYIPTDDSESLAHSRAAKTEQMMLDVLTAFEAKSTTFAEWQKATGLPKSTFKDGRARLLERGRIIQKGNVYRIAQVGPGAEIRPDQGSPPLAA